MQEHAFSLATEQERRSALVLVRDRETLEPAGAEAGLVANRLPDRGILVKTGYGATEATMPPPGMSADAVCENLIDAVVWLQTHAES